MLKLPISIWIWCLFKISTAIPLPPSYIFPVPGNWTDNGINVQEDQVPYYVLDDSDREKRDSDLDDLGLETVSFEVPTILKMNESKIAEDLPLDQKIQDALSLEAALGSPGTGSSFLRSSRRKEELHKNVDHRDPLEFNISHEDRANFINPVRKSHVISMTVNSPTKKPITITILLENVLPPGKADRYIITNSSEIRGCGALLKVKFQESKTTPASSCNDEADICKQSKIVENNLDNIEFKSRKRSEGNKVEDEDEDDDEMIEQKSIKDVLRKILSIGNLSSSTPNMLDEVYSSQKSGEPLTVVLKPSPHNKPLSKPIGAEGSRLKSPSLPEYDHLCKLLEQLSSHLPKDKLLTLLTSLVTRVSDGHE